jgi:LysM repeat protein
VLSKLLKQFFQTILRNKGQGLSISITLLAGILVIGITWWYHNRPALAAIAAATSPTLPAAAPVSLDRLATRLIITPAAEGIARQAQPHTVLPAKPRFDVTQYVVEAGDTVFGIAKKFDLNPQTILWGNYFTLIDDPHQLRPGQKLNILPVDGVYYQWHTSDNLNKVASFFGVKAEDILDFPGNHIDKNAITDIAHPGIKDGAWIIVPDGVRQMVSWSGGFVTRTDPAAAKIYGPGFCGKIMTGAIGTGSFVWPTVEHWISGFNFSPETNHMAIDVAGQMGNAIYAADSGVVVYSGWNNYGYGNVIVIDHGNGWQTLYGHLSVMRANCADSVIKGAVIGNMGSTGNSSGPHLHFEMLLNGARQNPHQYLPAP